jgi:pseudouridine-5'-monophosphatase
LKVSGQKAKALLDFFHSGNRILRDDLLKNRVKLAPDIYLAALESLNSALDSKERSIMPNEYLVFEDSAVGVMAGIRAGMRVVWVPHPDLAAEYQTREGLALAVGTELLQTEDLWQLRGIYNGYIDQIPSLDWLNCTKYGIVVPPGP